MLDEMTPAALRGDTGPRTACPKLEGSARTLAEDVREFDHKAAVDGSPQKAFAEIFTPSVRRFVESRGDLSPAAAREYALQVLRCTKRTAASIGGQRPRLRGAAFREGRHEKVEEGSAHARRLVCRVLTCNSHAVVAWLVRHGVAASAVAVEAV